jgi:dUTPase
MAMRHGAGASGSTSSTLRCPQREAHHARGADLRAERHVMPPLHRRLATIAIVHDPSGLL